LPLARFSLYNMLAPFSREDLIFAHLTFQRSVKQEKPPGMFQSDTVEALFPIAQYIGPISGKEMLQPLTDHAVQLRKLIHLYPFSVGRICNQYTLLVRRLGILLKRLYAQVDILLQPGIPDIFLGNCDRFWRNVGTYDPVAELAGTTVVVIDITEKLLVEIA